MKPVFTCALVLVLSLMLAEPMQLAAQEVPGPESSPALESPEPVTLPDQDALVQALADPGRRDQAVLTLIALRRLVNNPGAAEESAHTTLVAEFSSERSRLNQVAAMNKYQHESPASLDLASQVLQLELAQHDLRLWQDRSAASEQLKIRAMDLLFSSDRLELAAAVLPIVLAAEERGALGAWQAIREQNEAGGPLVALINALPSETWTVFKQGDGTAEPAEEINQELARLAEATIAESPPDPQVLIKLRRLLLLAGEESNSPALLGLADAIDGLHDHHYLQFAQYLLGMSFELIEQYSRESSDETVANPLANLALQILPGISAAYARDFADVDPRINSTVAAVFNVLTALQSDVFADPDAMRRELTDALAQMLLLVPDAAYYFDQPVRNRIREEIDICTSIVATAVPGFPAPVSREQFDGCISSFNRLVNRQARDAALSGNPSGPFESDQLRRELSLPGWQRINYTLGFLAEVTEAEDCEVEGPDLVNPVEWALLASTFRWFADQRPVYFQTPESEQQLEDMIAAGEHMIDQLRSQANCFALAEGADSVNRAISLYRLEVNELLQGVNEVQVRFKEANFKQGADADFTGDALQQTNYRPGEITIGPCDELNSCEMTNELSATRALVGLFPTPFLIADQSRMGDIEICYDNIRWINRRSENARKNDPQVANYFGNFSFDLRGRFGYDGRHDEVFVMNLQAPDEYHYLFAANDEEILEKPCPMDLVGSSIITELIGSGLPIVPNRLTYLTAARTLPSRLFAENWESGAEWRDWFITGTGVEQILERDGAHLIDPVNTHLQQLHQRSEYSVYTALVNQPLRFAGESDQSLARQVGDVSSAKSLVRAVISLFASDTLQFNDKIRSALEGNRGLLDNRNIRRLRDSGTPVSQINAIALARLQEFQQAWNREPEAMRRAGIISKPVLMAYLQLLDLRQRYFSVVQPAPEPLDSITPQAGGDAAPLPSPESSTPPQEEPESTLPAVEQDSTSSP